MGLGSPREPIRIVPEHADHRFFPLGNRRQVDRREAGRMIQRAALTHSRLYETDETAWLDAMAELIRQGRWDELDYPHLAEYLTDMARRDRREVESRLATLLTHVLKWIHQPDHRSNSWRGTIIEQRQELARLVERGVLRNHAEAVLANVYAQAVERAAAETGAPAASFPEECPSSLEQLLSADILAEPRKPR
jgi:hypothetical protein